MTRCLTVLLGATLTGVSILTASCNPTPEGSPSATATSPSNSTSIESTPTTETFAEIDSCFILDRAMQGKGFPSGESDDIGSDNGCQTNKPQVASYSLDLITNAGLSQWADTAKAHKGSINGRDAVQEPYDDSVGCAVAMEISSNAIASVGISRSNGTVEEACDRVTEVAETVETMLPDGN